MDFRVLQIRTFSESLNMEYTGGKFPSEINKNKHVLIFPT